MMNFSDIHITMNTTQEVSLLELLNEMCENYRKAEEALCKDVQQFVLMNATDRYRQLALEAERYKAGRLALEKLVEKLKA